ncbi:MAG: class I SAM-dependent methyltransferase [Acidimicrobiia bacterium]
MGFYADNVVPRIVNVACSRADIAEARRRVAEGLAGDVVEVGFGSGLNIEHYPPVVTKVLAVDPSAVGRRLAARRLAASQVPVEFAGLDGEQLSLPDASVDAALSTFTLCTIGDLPRALGELRRVLRPGGRLHFLEHGLSPSGRVARWQHRLTPVQRRLCGGCHLDRPIDRLIDAAGFEISALRNYHLKGPKTVGYMYEGVAQVGQ